MSAYDLANSIIKVSGLISDTLTDRSPESMSKLDNVQELLKAVHEFVDAKKSAGEPLAMLPDFLSEVSLLTDQDTDKDTDKNKVTLMTVHAAKGLEFKVVFIVGMEEELFPSPFCTDNERELEEERRLFYVAITRAEERCIISYSKSRFRNGKTNFSNPSRFIKDIDKQYLEMPAEEVAPKQSKFSDWDEDLEFERKRFEPKYAAPTKTFENFAPTTPKRFVKLPNTSGSSSSPTENSSFPTGTFVKHAIFGIGKILGTNMVDGNEKAEIDFGEKGKKSLLLKFAKLEKLE